MKNASWYKIIQFSLLSALNHLLMHFIPFKEMWQVAGGIFILVTILSMICICLYKMGGDNSIYKRRKRGGDEGQGGSDEVRFHMELEISNNESSGNITKNDHVESGG